MKLESSLIKYIKNAADTARLIGVEIILIDSEAVRATNENKTVLIMHNENIPELPFKSICMSNIDLFQNRIALVDNQDGYTVEAGLAERDNQVISLTMKCSNIKVDYRCANSMILRKVPTSINDPMKYRIALNQDAVNLLSRAQAAMGTETVNIVGNKQGISFEMIDSNGDVFSNMFTEEVTNILDKTSVGFVLSYPIKVLLPLFKHKPDGVFYIGEEGLLKITTNNLDVYVLPKTD